MLAGGADGTAAPTHGEPSAPSVTTAKLLFTQLSGAVTAAMTHLGDRLGLYRRLADVGPTDAAGLAAAARSACVGNRAFRPGRRGCTLCVMEGATLADVAERLMAEFEGRLSLAVISDIVRGSAHDLAGHLHPAALPELVERSARQRLLARLDGVDLAG